MFSWYKYLIVSLVFSHLGFWSGNLFLIAPLPDLCLLVPFHCAGGCFERKNMQTQEMKTQGEYLNTKRSNKYELGSGKSFLRAFKNI